MIPRPTATPRRAKVIALTLTAGALLAIGFLYVRLPELAPLTLLRWGYEPSGGTIIYTGLRPPSLEDATEEYIKRTFLVPGPDKLEVDRFKDGRVAMLTTGGRRRVIFQREIPIPEKWLLLRPERAGGTPGR